MNDSAPALYRVAPGGNCTQVPLTDPLVSDLIDWHIHAQQYLLNDRSQDLYQYRTPYIGSASDVGAVLGALGISQVLGEYTTELQTTTEPLWPHPSGSRACPRQTGPKEYLRQMGGGLAWPSSTAPTISPAP